MKAINDKIKNGKMLETIFNNTHFLVAYMDNDFNFINVNRAYAEKHNKEPDFFVGKNHFDLYPKGNESIFKKVIETGEPYFAYSKPLDHPVSGISYWDWAIQPIKSENGEVNAILLSLTDVTEYKRNEEEIQKEQREFIDEVIEKRTAELLSEKEKLKIESEKNMENELIELNEKIEELENANRVLNEKLKSQVSEEEDELQIEAFDKQIEKLKNANEGFQKIIAAKDPQIEELILEMEKLKNAQNNSEDTLSSKLSEISDLNERITQLENDASEKEEIISKRELEIEKLDHEIMELEKKGTESAEIIKIKESEIEEINKNVDALKDALNDSKETISVKDLNIKELNEEISKLITLKDDSAEIISIEMQEIQELNEKISTMEQNIRKLTKRNGILQSELENNTNDEELLKQLDELIKANEELEKFAETAVNELQEPLRAIKSFNNILARRYRGKLDKDADEFIDYALEAVERLNNKIIGLLEYSRVESRGKEFKLTETEELLDYAMSNLNASLEGNGAKITHENLPKIMADSGQILQLFQNLLKNSVKFKNPEKNAMIHVSAYLDEENNEYVFSVQDNGIGIEEKDQQKVFDIFIKLNPKQPGIGIGLSISKKIVERHGGRVWVESEPEIGSKFFFTMPKL
jgi:PAS domain S-box-containing protein